MYTDPLIEPALLEAQIKKHQKTETPLPLTFGVNIYTDGGCKGRDAGYGVHGYVFCNTPVKTGCGVTGYSTTDFGYIVNNKLVQGVMLSDMFNLSNRGRQDVQIVQPFAYFDGSGSLLDSTNNIGETVAFIRSVDLVERLHKELGITTVHFGIDSKYVINNILTRFDIINNNWCNRSGPIANKEYWQEAFTKLEALACLGIKWTIEWVEGHSDNFGNIQADRLATKGRTAAANGYVYDEFKVQPAQGRWGATGVDMKSNPALYFMTDSKWYYDPLMEHEDRDDGLVPLFLGNHDDHEHAGQPNARDCISIGLMRNPPRHLRRLVDVADRLNRVENGYEVRSSFCGVVNNILKPEFEDQILNDGDGFVLLDDETKVALTYDGKEIIRSFSPPLLSIQLMNSFMGLHDIIDRVVAGKLMPGDCLTDVTHLFFGLVEGAKNKNVLKVIAPNDASIKAKVGVSFPDANHVYQTLEADVTLTYGTTAPRYRVFGGIKDHNPKVFVLTTYEPVTGFRYYTVTKLSTGEWGIWSNPNGNLQRI